MDEDQQGPAIAAPGKEIQRLQRILAVRHIGQMRMRLPRRFSLARKAVEIRLEIRNTQAHVVLLVERLAVIVAVDVHVVSPAFWPKSLSCPDSFRKVRRDQVAQPDIAFVLIVAAMPEHVGLQRRQA